MKGTSRQVFLVGKYAIKIPNFYSHKTFLNGCRDNWTEGIFYRDFKGCYFYGLFPERTGKEDLTELVVPSLFCSWFGFIQIQLRAEPLKRELTYTEKQKYKGVCSDLQSSDFGILNGRLLCFDYAQ